MNFQIGSGHTRPQLVDPGPIDNSKSSVCKTLGIGGLKGWAEGSESLYTIHREYCGISKLHKEDGC
jgi:hypothetical protein